MVEIVTDIIIENDRNEFLFLKRKATDSVAASKWCFPGGHVEFGEANKEAAVRELLEETGVSVKDLTKLGKIQIPGFEIILYYLKISSNIQIKISEEHDAHALINKQDLIIQFTEPLFLLRNNEESPCKIDDYSPLTRHIIKNYILTDKLPKVEKHIGRGKLAV